MTRGGDSNRDVSRRTVLATLGSTTLTGLAGCSISLGGKEIEIGKGGGNRTGDTGGSDPASERKSVVRTVEPEPMGEEYTRYIAVLEDGRKVVLNDVARMKDISARAPDLSGLGGRLLREAGASESVARRQGGESVFSRLDYSGQPRPEKVDLRSEQTPLRNQRGRGTCVDFSTIAAMEARIKRKKGENVDLSEQYANHISKMIDLNGKPPGPNGSENTLGLLSGGGTPRSLAVYSMYAMPAIPADGTPRYVRWKSYGKPWDTGDDPFRKFWKPTTATQRTVNDFNLAEGRISIDIPWGIQVTPFPQSAIDAATYFVGEYEVVNDGSKLQDPAFYERQLANDQEVIIDLNWCMEKGSSPATPDKSNCIGGHSVLLVGYDRTGDSNYFIAKNSWKEYTKLHYDVARKGLMFTAAMVTDIVEDRNNSFRTDRNLGRWSVRYDGQFALLDVRRLPGFHEPSDLNGMQDRRVGEFWEKGTQLNRVNGTVVDNGGRAELELYVDFANPNTDYEDTGGTTFTVRLDHDDARLIAGTYEKPSGEKAGFYGTKDRFFRGTVDASWVSASAMVGEWELHSPVLDGRVEFRSATTDGSLSGRHYYEGSAFVSTTGSLETGTNALTVELPTAAEQWTFEGYVFANEPGVASGTVTNPDDDKEYPLVLARVGPARTSIEITAPQDGDTFQAGEVSLSATVEQDGERIDTDRIVWTLGGSYGNGTVIGTGATTTHDFSPGTRRVHATYTGGEDRALASDIVTVTINTPEAPDVTIERPDDGQFFGRDDLDGSTGSGAYAEITAEASATAGDGTPLTGDALQWAVREEGRSDWTDTGTGERTTVRLVDDACGGVGYEIRLRATDSNGRTGTALVTVTIDGIFC